MKVNLRLGELDSDTAPLLRLLQEQLSPSIDRRRFDWLYRQCPHGEAIVWVAEESDSGRLVAAATVFPRKVRFGGRSENGFVLGDFCVSASYRSLGLAIQLQRKCLESIHIGAFAAGFDLPSRSMLAIYRRLGSVPGGQLVRMARVLRAEGKILAKVKSKTAARVLGKAANALLKLQGGSLRIQSGISVEIQQGRCGQEFTDLWNGVGDRLGTCVERSAEYLNWRYLDHPQQKYEILAARRQGRLEGYLTLCQESAVATVVDWFGREPAEVRNDLIRGMIVLLKTRQCESVQAAVLESHRYRADLQSLGFRPRESSSVVFFGAAVQRPKSKGENGNWLLMDGDRES
jgi:hypothetical protein